MEPTRADHGGGAAGTSGKPLLVLQGAGSLIDPLPSKAGRVVEDWLSSREGVLWLQGPEGSGRTTLAGVALRRAVAGNPGLLRGAFRVEGFPGKRFEEALFEVGQFLLQMGIGDLSEVLGQRTSLTAKISIFFKVLRSHPVLIWFDDFDRLTAAGGMDSGLPMRFFAQSCSELDDSPGKLLVVTEAGGPDGLDPRTARARRLVLDPESGIRSADLLSRLDPLQAPRANDGEAAPSGASPLEVRLRHLALAAAGPHGREEVLRGLEASGLAPAVREIRRLLEPPVRRVLDVAAAFGGPLRRSALRGLSTLDPQELERAAREVLRRGLSEEVEEDGRILSLHPAVAAAVEEAARQEDGEAWQALQSQVALHLLEVGNRTGSLWHLLRSRERLFRLGQHKEAYEVQKTFLEEILRHGLNELARLVLLESASTLEGPQRAVCLGNLAIIHKNEGNLDEAARLYEEVRAEFEKMGDFPNMARVYHQLGNTHYLRGDLDLALENYRRSLDISLEIGERAVSTATKIQVANVQYIRGEHEEALESYRDTLRLAEEIQDRTIAAAVHLQIGQLLFSLRRMSEAEEELRIAEREADELGDRRNRIKVSQLLGLVAGELRDYEIAIGHLERAVEISSSIGDPLEMAACLLRIGILEVERLQFSKAAAAFFRALDLLDGAAARGHIAGASADIQSYRRTIDDRLQELAVQVGPEVFARLLRGLGREGAFPLAAGPAGPEQRS